MKILTSEEMRAVDRTAIDDWGFPSLVLMENAAIGVADAVGRLHGSAKSILVFCGPGNNGGDGLAVARHLGLRGCTVRVLLIGWSHNRSADAAWQLEVIERAGVAVTRVEETAELRNLAPEGLIADLWIDALFGTGLSRPLEGAFAEASRWLSSDLVPVLSVDLPSGLDASQGETIGASAQATTTVALGTLKHAHVFAPAAQRCGQVVVADLGIPELILEQAGKLELLTREGLRQHLIQPTADDHKGSFGHCLIVAGATGRAGAAVLVARGAVLGGAGLVTVAVPEPLASNVDTASLESMTLPLSADRSGGLTVDAADEVQEAAAEKSCLAIGPGLGTRGATVEAIKRLLRDTDLPVVLDADGLNACLGETEILRQRSAPTILTPHPGEAARLFATDVESIQGDRVGFARQQAVDLGLVVVLKGHQTVIAAADGRTWVNSTGNPGMGSGGSGDVLTGLIAAMVSRNYDPVVAAALGVYIHGLSGDLAAESKGLEALHAGDLLATLPTAFQRLGGE